MKQQQHQQPFTAAGPGVGRGESYALFHTPAMAAAVAETEECLDAFICPITLEVMRDPVFFAGDDELHSFERHSALQWVGAGNRTHPVTGAPLTSIAVKPNRILRNVINDWRELCHTPHPVPPLITPSSVLVVLSLLQQIRPRQPN